MLSKSVRNMTRTAILTAMVFVLTAYLHIPVGNGYVHLGDGIIYLSACMLPLPYGLFVGIVGASMADVMSGFALWAPATALIKGLTVLCFRRGDKPLCLRNIVAMVIACVLCAGGYYLYEAVLYSNFIAPVASIPGNLMQSLCSAALFLLLSGLLSKTELWKK